MIFMKHLLMPVSLLLFALSVGASTNTVIPLWPEDVPNGRTNAPDEEVANNRIVNVNKPTLTIYTPDKPCHTAVIFCPGGGYHHLTIGENGGEETKWLNSLGVTVFILKYRMKEYGHPAPLQDVLRAVRLVRSRAAEFGVATNCIGLLGQSAGGHLAACAATLWDSPEGRTGAPLDKVSARPDFAMLVYPVITMDNSHTHKGSRQYLLGEHPAPELVEHLSLERQVRPNTPPIFLAATMADKAVPVENTLNFYQALKDAGVPAEMHVYAQGSHGDSLDRQYGPTAEWPQRAAEWLRFNGWLDR